MDMNIANGLFTLHQLVNEPLSVEDGLPESEEMPAAEESDRGSRHVDEFLPRTIAASWSRIRAILAEPA